MNELAEIFGWYGTIAILLAYLLNAFGIIEASSGVYLWLNITGALGAIAIGYRKKVWQSVAMNVIWLIIGLTAIAKALL